MSNVWTNTDFTGHYPVGVSAVVVTRFATDAADILNEELKKYGLKGDAEASGMVLIDTNKDGAYVLQDGDY